MSPEERTTRMAAPDHPPCAERCWCWLYRMGDGERVGWVLTVPANRACRWDEERKQWTRCQEGM